MRRGDSTERYEKSKLHRTECIATRRRARIIRHRSSSEVLAMSGARSVASTEASRTGSPVSKSTVSCMLMLGTKIKVRGWTPRAEHAAVKSQAG